MKILVLGKNGYVGKLFTSIAGNKNILSIGRDDCNYYNPKLLRAFIKANNVGFLINAAGYTGKPNVDACEFAKAECLSGNAVLPGIIREVCEDLKTPWGHVSVDVFIPGADPMEKDGLKKMSLTLLSGDLHAVFTVEQKHLVKKF